MVLLPSALRGIEKETFASSFFFESLSDTSTSASAPLSKRSKPVVNVPKQHEQREEVPYVFLESIYRLFSLLLLGHVSLQTLQLAGFAGEVIQSWRGPVGRPSLTKCRTTGPSISVLSFVFVAFGRLEKKKKRKKRFLRFVLLK